MLRKNTSTSDTWELASSLGNHREFAQCFRFAFAAAVVLLLTCLAFAPPVLAQSSASDWVNSGIAKGKKGDLNGAIADYNRAIEINPKNALAFNNRGNAKSNKGDQDGAITDFNRAIEINPSYANAFNNRGIAKGKKGDLSGAIADYNRAIEINPNYANAYNNRGVAKRKKGNMDEAIADFSRAIGIDPNHVGAYYNRADAILIKGDLDKAIADFNRAIEIDPNYAKAYNNRGNAKSMRGDLDGAIADFSRIIEIDPKNALAYNNRGSAFQAKGRFDQAVDDLTRAIELDTKDEYVYLRLLVATWSAKGDDSMATDRLRNHVAANNSDLWVRTISKYYLGIDNLNEQAILAEARKGKDGKEVGERLCEAYYYLGVKRLFGGNRKGAAEYFTLSIDTGIKRFTEYDSSKAMLTLMKGGKI